MKKELGPNFLVVGAAKCGTTSLYYQLQKHKEVFLPQGIKETYYFLDDFNITGNGKGYFEKEFIEEAKSYYQLYKNTSRAYRGEVCNGYLYFYQNAIPKIKAELGDPHIIILIRNPIYRAHSSYMHLRRDQIVAESFEEALLYSEERKKEKWWWAFHIKEIGTLPLRNKGL